MDYKDLEVIWGTQQENPVFRVNTATLSNRLQRETTKSVRRSFWSWKFYQVISLFMFFMLIAEPIFEHHDYYQIPAAIAFLGLFFFLFKVRPEKRNGEVISQSSIRRNIEASLKQATSDYAWFKGVIWWIFGTFLFTIVSSFIILYGKKPIWLWVGALACWGYWIFTIRRDSRRKASRVADLQSLRDQLIKPDQA
jgi:hypothetical protein